MTFTGADYPAGPATPRPNSDAAAAAFMAAAGPTTLIDFESLTTGYFSTLNVATGVTATLTNNDSDIAGISDDSSYPPLGFNTTSGGSHFVSVAPIFETSLPASLTFTFTTPISSFGAYLTGTETAFTGSIVVSFNDGASQSISITKNSSAGVQYFGFVDSNATITSVTFTESGDFSNNLDIWGLDDLRFGTSTAAVPEPTSLALLGLGSIGLFAVSRRRKAPRNA